MAFSQIKSISFSGLRRLNPITSTFMNFEEKLSNFRKEKTTYHFESINIFSGRNGGGKSTVLELIDFLRDPNRLCTLPRENRRNDSDCFFEINFENKFNILGYSLPAGLKKNEEEDSIDYQFLWLIKTDSSGNAVCNFKEDISKNKLSDNHYKKIKDFTQEIGCSVTMWSPEKKEDYIKGAEILNAISKHLAGLETDPLSPLEKLPWENSPITKEIKYQDGLFRIYHSDDRTQSNRVRPESLPSGWRTIISIMSYLEERRDGEICLLEEPENHLHPALQRVLADLIAKIASKKNLQIFLTTHSMTLQSRYIWGESSIKFFEAKADKLVEGIDERSLLDALGISGAEYGSCDGVIWVEGPSDRIYLKHWINLYCHHHNFPIPLEHRDYIFAFHGGSLLAHLSANEGDEKINILRLNRNYIVLMDRDNDFIPNLPNSGKNILRKNCKNNQWKNSILKKTEEINSPTCKSFVTPGYTIESSLPSRFRNKFFKKKAQRLIHIKKKKVEIALEYTEEFNTWNICFDSRESMALIISSY